MTRKQLEKKVLALMASGLTSGEAIQKINSEVKNMREYDYGSLPSSDDLKRFALRYKNLRYISSRYDTDKHSDELETIEQVFENVGVSLIDTLSEV